MAEIGELKVGDDVVQADTGKHASIVHIGKVRMFSPEKTFCTVAWNFGGRFPTIRTHHVEDLKKLEY